MTSIPAYSLGFLGAHLVSRATWQSKRLPDCFLDLSTCHGLLEPDRLPLSATAEALDSGDGSILVELGLDAVASRSFQNEDDLRHFDLWEAPKGTLIGYEILGFEYGGSSWHSPHCNNVADTPEGQDIEFTPLGLIESYEMAVKLADWMLTEASAVEPVAWFPVSVHAVAGVELSKKLNPRMGGSVS